jgi:RimJ/RimL family protein N-acetyltransferase
VSEVVLERWTDADYPVLQRNNTPEMTVYLGGPESQEKLVARQAKFMRLWAEGEARMFTIHVPWAEVAVGSVGYWKTTHAGADVLEAGWGVATEFQGHGVARAALIACLADATRFGERDLLYAFPRIDNAASNALCRTVGMTWTAEEDFEYPPGHPIRVNAWVRDLAALR